MEVTAAYDGEEALALAKSGEFDLILLDVMLPKLTGFEVCQQGPGIFGCADHYADGKRGMI